MKMFNGMLALIIILYLFVLLCVCTDNTMQVLLKQLELKRSGQFITPKMLHLILNYLKQAYV